MVYMSIQCYRSVDGGRIGYTLFLRKFSGTECRSRNDDHPAFPGTDIFQKHPNTICGQKVTGTLSGYIRPGLITRRELTSNHAAGR